MKKILNISLALLMLGGSAAFCSFMNDFHNNKWPWEF